MRDNGETVTLKAKSYHAAQERLRVAEACLREQERQNESTRAWAERAFDEQDRLRLRCEYLYGLAARHGASDDELHGPRETIDMPRSAT